MEEFFTTFGLAVFETLLWIAYVLLLAVGWCLWMTLVAGGRFGLAVVRVGRRALVRRAARRELATIAFEYQAAVADIRAISDATRRRLRHLNRMER